MFSETETRSQTLTNDELTKKYFRDHKLSGIFKDVDPFTGELREEGRFERGKEVG